MQLDHCPAPAKLNLFLHVIGRRDDGYHILQSAFQLIDLADTLHFARRDDGAIVRVTGAAGIAPEDDLVVRAARLLQQHSKTRFGVEIAVEKRIPLGGGLGGGSSDAATTLIALNRLWELGLSRRQLLALALPLGADVPFFVFGRNAFVEGVGEELSALDIAPRHYAVVHPGVSVPTAAIFSAPELTRDSDPIKMSDFCASAQARGDTLLPSFFGNNDLQAVAASRFPEVARALEWLGRFGPSRMTGSGACVFGIFDSHHGALEALRDLPASWSGWACASLPSHPLAHWVEAEATE